MNIIILTINLLFIIKNSFAHIYQNTTDSSNNIHLRIKRDSISNECQYINSLLKKEESYNCCNHPGITCENDHIVSM